MAPKVEHKRHCSKHKIDRRLGVNLWGRQKSPVNARSYAPGQHGQRRKKPTDFGIQLMAKQKLKGYYGCLLYTSPSPRDRQKSRMPSSA